MSGDMADFTINDFFDLLDGAASDDGPEAPALVACRACGQGGLSWTQCGESWRLQEPSGKTPPVPDRNLPRLRRHGPALGKGRQQPLAPPCP